MKKNDDDDDEKYKGWYKKIMEEGEIKEMMMIENTKGGRKR